MTRGEMPDWAVDAAVESAQAARAEHRRAETVRAVCAEMRDHSVGDASEAYYDRYAWDILIDRILAAHDREMAAVMAERDAEILRRATLEREIAAKDAEVARLKAALKPVLECEPLSMNYDECDFITDNNAGSGDYWRIADMVNAVHEAQRIMKEGEVK